MSLPKEVRDLIEGSGSTVQDSGALPDGSGFATASYPLRKNHWIFGKKGPVYDAPPMPFRMGFNDGIEIGVNGKTELLTRKQFEEKIREAGRYAVRSATMLGTEMDFDPDALIQNLITGMLGYCTEDGLSDCDDWANPPHLRKKP